MNEIQLIGVPIDSVGRSGGTELAPAALRELGISAVLNAGDAGDLDVRVRGEERDPATGIVGSADVLATTSTLRTSVASALAGGARPFLLGGCCAELPGALAGARDRLGRIGLAYLDGHLDLYDGVTSPTGEAADMPVAVALGRGPERWVEAAGGPSLAVKDAAIVGYRDRVESLEHGMLQPEELGRELTHVSVDDLRVSGARAVAERVAAGLAAEAPFWLHLDVDVLDQEVFGATDYLMPNGMSWEELGDCLGPFASSPALAGVSLACYNPEKDPGRRCGRALIEALGAAFSG
ncbi:MAG: arginase family protein [Solirubrobacterales bacterium]